MAVAPSSPAQSVSRSPLLYMAIGIIIGVLLTLGVHAGVQAWQVSHTPDAAFLSKNRSADKTVVQTPSGLQYKILTAGKGPKPSDADVALVTYEGKLVNGTTFDKSERPTPMKVSEVVPGFSEGLKLMSKGSKFRFWIKPSLGYGDKATGPIPANSVLVFDVEMLDFLPEMVIRQMQAQQQMQMGGGAAAPGAGAPPAAPAPQK